MHKAEEAAESTEAAQAEGEDDEHAGGAFNPVTGEINWDCPCLGGMAHGPCGMQFREAFSCFVFSDKEPKGIDCVEKFKAMQQCFREHPEIYADGMFHTPAEAGYLLLTCERLEIMDDDDDDDEPLPAIASGEFVPEAPTSTSHTEAAFVPEEPSQPSSSTTTTAA